MVATGFQNTLFDHPAFPDDLRRAIEEWCFANAADERKPGQTDAFTDKYVFPGGYIPALSEAIAASQKMRLIATDIETLRLHYAKTLREWYRHCLEHRDEIVAMFDERFFRMWTFYLSGSTAAFESGGMCNYQIQYARNRHALPLTRGYIEEEERRLLGAGGAVASAGTIA